MQDDTHPGTASPNRRVVPYEPALRSLFDAAFRTLNLDWIETHFSIEPGDEAILGDPQGAVLDRGGRILFVVEGVPAGVDEILGTCALVPHEAGVVELAKMAVARRARGQGCGRMLMEAALQHARAMGARRVVLLSSTKLQPALALYRAYGFREAPTGLAGTYARGDVQMVRAL